MSIQNILLLENITVPVLEKEYFDGDDNGYFVQGARVMKDGNRKTKVKETLVEEIL